MPGRYDIWRRTARVAGWALMGIGTLLLLMAAVNTGAARKCSGVEVAFATGTKGEYVLTDDVLRWMGVGSAGSLEGSPLKDMDLRAMERRIEREPWVRDAELYVDRNRVLHVHITERRPVARIFTEEGRSFYIDSSTGTIPLNPSHTPRTIVFTGLPLNGKSWSRSDSLLVAGVRDIALALASDSLLSSQVEQVDLDPQKEFVMTPKMGEHAIVFGDASDIDVKFRKLKVFYQQVLSAVGWSAYSEIDLRFSGQVVALPSAGSENPTVTMEGGVTASPASPASPTVKGPLSDGVDDRRKPEAPKAQDREAEGRRPKAVMSARD